MLAQGLGASDVVRDMWKLSWDYPAQPGSVPVGGESRHQDTETCVQTGKHRNLVCCVCLHSDITFEMQGQRSLYSGARNV